MNRLEVPTYLFDLEIFKLLEYFVRHFVNSAAIYDERHTVYFVFKIRVFDISRSMISERNHGIKLQQEIIQFSMHSSFTHKHVFLEN